MQGSGVLCTLLQRYVARLDERGFLAAGNYIRCCGSEMVFFGFGYDFLRLFRMTRSFVECRQVFSNFYATLAYIRYILKKTIINDKTKKLFEIFLEF
jgi:hypothetical protein